MDKRSQKKSANELHTTVKALYRRCRYNRVQM
jgi:hypothetical protein